MDFTDVRRASPKIASFVLAFGLSKGVAFAGPLFLSQIMAIGDYGAIEFGLSVGTIVAQVLSLGVTGAVFQIVLIRKRPFSFGYAILPNAWTVSWRSLRL